MEHISMMEQVREYLKDTGFLQAHLNSTDFENLILKPSEDRIELIRWCLSEIDETLRDKLLHIRDNELKDELVSLTRKLGLSSEYDRDTILGLGGKESQIAFWLKLLHVVKCVQHSNKLPAEQQFNTWSNTSKMWCELLENSKYTESSRTKMNLVPIELKIGAQHQMGSFSLTSFVKEKDSLQKQLQAKKEKLGDLGLLHMNDSTNNHGVNISAADLKANAEHIKEMSTKLNHLYQDELKSQSRQPRPHVHSQEADALKNIIPNVFEQVSTFTQTARLAEMVVTGFETAVQLKEKSNYGNDENLGSEILKCYKFIGEK